MILYAWMYDKVGHELIKVSSENCGKFNYRKLEDYMQRLGNEFFKDGWEIKKDTNLFGRKLVASDGRVIEVR